MTQLEQLVDHYGSDKNLSGYTHTYNLLFEDIKEDVTSVLEIGIGTLDSTHPSTFAGNKNLFPQYTPGGSLRVWRDYFKRAEVYGIDIAEDCMIEEDRITTFLMDSTNTEEVENNLRNLKFDVIIDDGNHHPLYQLNTLRNLFKKLKKNGLYIIEDIGGYSKTDPENSPELLIDYIEDIKSIIGNCSLENRGNHAIIRKDVEIQELTKEVDDEGGDLTLVTGLWNIGRSERDFENHYIPNFKKLLEVELPLIVFVPKELVNLVKDIRGNKKTFIREMNLEDIRNLYSPFWDNTQKIRTNSEWLNITGEGGWLKHSPQATLEYYNPIVQSKMFMLHDASIWNPFNTDYFFWIDAGITNTVNSRDIIEGNALKHLPKYGNPWLFLSYPYEHAGEVHGFDAMELERIIGEPVKYVCRGGLFGGHREHIGEANATYYSILMDTLTRGYMGTEETVFTIMAYQEPYLYRRYALDGNGLIQKCIDYLKEGNLTLEPAPNKKVKNPRRTSDKVINNIKTNLYILTFNFPEQLRHTLKSMEKTPEWLTKPSLYLLDNSTDEEAILENKQIAAEWGFTYIGLGANTGINGGRFAAAAHFDASDADYMFFFEDDMTSNPPSEQGKFCRNGFRKYIPNLYTILHKIMLKESFDFLKLSFTEVFMDNHIQTSWYNVPQEIRTRDWPHYDRLPVQGLDPNSPLTKFNNIDVVDGVSYIDGEVYYSNWPMIVSKEGNKKMFLTTTWARPYEQTWMSYMYQEAKKGLIRGAVLLCSPILHERIKYYKPEERREN